MENKPPLIVADIYQVMDQIGSGGGGVVYLAEHLRLNKKVVLKADKRTLRAKPEVLRREVDALKNLSHTYIPQVYDFITENGTVYTVMDYIDGESFDKPLKRGERFSQACVIEWACQLLEALVYLHSRPPHGILHADIKPSNVMLTPQGDIRLIDFNIALALGEEGAVAVGRSFGYASPEHYGLDYTSRNQTRGLTTNVATSLSEENNGVETVWETSQASQGSSNTSSRKSILLDERSDIYSLGATLYHILTGERPAQDAAQVKLLSPQAFSPAVIAIIQKAMDPDPDQRYQTAKEMLYAFEHLHENDPRTKRHKRRAAVTAAILTAAFFAGGLCSFAGLRQMQQAEATARFAAEEAEEAERKAKQSEQDAKEALAAVWDSENAYQSGDIPGAAAFALTALTLDTPYNAQAQKALTDALGVYNLSDGFQSHQLLDLPSEPLKVVLSPEGTRTAAMTSGTLLVFDTATGEQMAALTSEPSALSDVVFRGENILIYAGEGAIRAYDLALGTELWAGQAATSIALSADGSTVAAVYKDKSEAVAYNAATGELLQTVDFHGLHQPKTANDVFLDPEDSIFTLNADGTLLAVSFSNGALWVFNLRDSDWDIELYDKSDFTHFEGGFFGPYFSFSARDSAGTEFAIIDTDHLLQMGYFSSTIDIHVSADESGIYVATGRLVTQLDPETMEESERAYASGYVSRFQIGSEHTILTTQDGGFAIFDANANLLDTWETDRSCDFIQIAGEYAVTASWDIPALRVLKLENHAQTQFVTYDADYAHNEARVSAGGGTVMLFRYDAFRLYAVDGTLLVDSAIPDAEQVYDQQYRRDEGCLEIYYNDGTILRYSAVDGSLLSTERGTPPDGTLYEEFLTDRLKITAPLHGTPAAYDRETGELVRELEKEDYLTYVTQLDGYVLTEYITAQGERYGLLLNDACETLARLPNLCDTTNDGRLVFDDLRGNIRQSRIYSLQELTDLASIFLKEGTL